MKIKIVCYNILNGFTTDEKPYLLDKKRVNVAVKVLEKENPDILVLCEGYLWPSVLKNNMKDFKKLIESLVKTPVPAENNFRYGMLVVSRFPINFTDVSEHHKKLLRCRIKIGKKTINLDTYHPSPDKITEGEKASFLGSFVDKTLPNHILAGDFNTLSPQDSYDEAKLLRGYSTFMGDRAVERVKGMMTAETVKLVLSKGFVDSYKIKEQKEKYTIPTDFRSKNKDSATRIDYIFCSKDIKILDAGIIKNELTEMASDHYPVYAVLEI